jgi:hypothetical protein
VRLKSIFFIGLVLFKIDFFGNEVVAEFKAYIDVVAVVFVAIEIVEFNHQQITLINGVELVGTIRRNSGLLRGGNVAPVETLSIP